MDELAKKMKNEQEDDYEDFQKDASLGTGLGGLGVGIGLWASPTNFLSAVPSTTGSVLIGAAAWAIIGAIVGYYIGGMIAKNQDWSPGKKQQFTMAMTAGGATVAAAGYVTYVAIQTQVIPFVGLLVVLIMLLWTIYESFFNDYTEQEYYIMKFECNVWQPPKEGDCSICNEDVRPCSEYRCKSLGSNCHYFIENGEPGYCASLSDIWQAIIKPDTAFLS